MYKLLLPPDQSGYAVTYGSGVVRQQLDGGRGRYRADILNPTNIVTVQWTLGPNEFDYFLSFYDAATSTAGEPFLASLYMDKRVLTQHECNFIPDSFRLISQSGLTFVVGATLEVKPTKNTSDNKALIAFYSQFNSLEEANRFLNLFEELVNVDLPKIRTGDIDPIVSETIIDENSNTLVDESGITLVGNFEDYQTFTTMDESGSIMQDENADTLVAS